MRIVHATPYYVPAFVYGGPIVSVHTLARAQALAGHDVHVVTTDRNGTKRLSLDKGPETTIDDVKVRYFSTLGLGAFAYSPEMGDALNREVEAFDILHVHGLFTYPTIVACRSARRRGTPYVLSPRGMLDPHAIARRGRLRKAAYIRAIESRNLKRAAFVHYTTSQERSLANQVVPTPRSAVVFNPVRLEAAPLSHARGTAVALWPQYMASESFSLWAVWSRRRDWNWFLRRWPVLRSIRRTFISLWPATALAAIWDG